MALGRYRGPAKAMVAVTRHLARILHWAWIDNAKYRWQAQSA